VRCAAGGAQFGRSEEQALSRRLAALVIAAIAGFVVLGSVYGHWFGHGAASGPAAEAVSNRFAGASKARHFLSAGDSAQGADQGLLPRGTRSIISTGRLAHGEWRWDDIAVPPGPVTVRVDLGRQLVSVFRGPDEIGTAVVVYGARGKETPRGRLPILGKTRDYHSVTYDAPMPFSLWLRGDGVALHGSSVKMGRATNGCIGVPVEFAKRLFAVAGTGDIVEVIGGSDPAETA
jgi:lipoprotein-anchoring transpeptidase ErfK/SrfK